MSNFCYAPWFNLVINNKQMGPCCYVGLTDNKHTIDEYLESTALAKLREEFLSGNKPDICNRCWSVEDAGGTSLRQLTPKADLSAGITDLEFSVGNACNLSCRSCNPRNSSKWRPLADKLDIKFDADVEPYLLEKPWYMESLSNHISNLKKVTMLGGEPFLGQLHPHCEFLQKLDANKLEELEYITNGTILPDSSIVEHWEEFKQVTITLSIDGVSDVYEYTRFPGKWHQIIDAVEFYSSLPSNVHIKVICTVSILNIVDLPNIKAWADKANISDIVYPLLNYPEYYSIKNLPLDAREYLIEYLTSNQFAEHANFLESLPDPKDVINDTRKYISAVDEIQNQSFPDLFPEFSRILQI